jgi:hypothetical protein
MDLLIVAIFAVIALLGLAAVTWGVDSRPAVTDPRVSDQSIGLS